MSGLDRIARAFDREQPAFMPYAVLGYPTREKSLSVVRTLVQAGADILELGVPFSDPLADGPVIQAATQRALDNGVTLTDCIGMVRQLRDEGIDTPALLMGYLNPMLAYGLAALVDDAARVSVDGFIVPDLPPEEAEELERLCCQAGLALIYFLSPTSTPERIELVAQRARGFIYLVSVTGVTGERQSVPEHLTSVVHQIRAVTDVPVVIGFGISNGAQARAIGGLADGVVVGSALVRCAGDSLDSVNELATSLKTSLRDIARQASLKRT